MARIHYGLAGEGRGHAARARTLIEELRRDHDVVVHAPGDAYAFLAPLYARRDRVDVREVPGLRWAYGRRGQVHLVRSALASAKVLAGLPGQIARLARTLRHERADLVVTDFEPLLSRAAVAARVPHVSVDHQAFLTTCDLRALPSRLRAHAAFMGTFVRRWSPAPRMRLVSSFYRAPLRADVVGDVRQVGVLLRRGVREARPTRGGFLLAYLRPGVPERALDVLRAAPLEVRLYGRGEGPREGALVRCPVSDAAFLADLAACESVVSTAGNQLIGEALALGKPVLAAPELGNREQEINAWFLERVGGGRGTTFQDFDARTLGDFLADRETLAAEARAAEVDGTTATLAALDEALARFVRRPLRPLRQSRNAPRIVRRTLPTPAAPGARTA